jgi:hypothetical protein
MAIRVTSEVVVPLDRDAAVAACLMTAKELGPGWNLQDKDSESVSVRAPLSATTWLMTIQAMVITSTAASSTIEITAVMALAWGPYQRRHVQRHVDGFLERLTRVAARNVPD